MIKCHSLHLRHHAVCSPSCENGGMCSSSGVCRCATGYTGSYCQSSSSSGSGEYKMSVCTCVLAHVSVMWLQMGTVHSLHAYAYMYGRICSGWIRIQCIGKSGYGCLGVYSWSVCMCQWEGGSCVLLCVCVCAYFACLLCCIWCLNRIIYDPLLQEGAERKMMIYRTLAIAVYYCSVSGYIGSYC